jgi:deoxyhypusine monooxygenase
MIAMHASAAEYDELQATLLNTSGTVPLAKRFRALFTLRNLKTHRAIDIIGQGVLGITVHPIHYLLRGV